jgi:hypothetical protein
VTPTTTVPYTITDEAAALLCELGLQKEFDRIVELLKEFVPGLLNIQARVMTMYDEENARVVLIACEMLNRQLDDDPTQREWGELFASKFPSEVRQHISVLFRFGDPDAR